MFFKQTKTVPAYGFCNQNNAIIGCLPSSSQLQIAQLAYPLKTHNFESSATLFQGFNPSSVNLLRVALLSDSTLANGYLLEMGGKEDNLKVILRKNQIDSILYQSKTLFNKSSNTLIYKCINTDSQLQVFWRLPDSSFHQFTIIIPNEISIQIHKLAFWGLELLQSGTTAAGKTKIANIYVGNYWLDTLPPAVSKILSFNNTSLKIEFSEPVQIQPNPLCSLRINKNTHRLLSPSNQISQNTLLLDSCNPYCNQTLQIQFFGLQDTAGNKLDSAQITQIQHLCSNNIQPGMLTITEIMYKPYPNKGFLPNSQYIELKNLSHNGYWLDSLRLSDPYTTGYPTQNHWLNPQSYVLLIPAKDTLLWNAFPKEQRLPISPWPAFNTTSDTLTLTNAQNDILAQIAYVNANLLSPYNNGGYSIEKPNNNPICINLFNWQNNQNKGGTPLSSSSDYPQICPPENRITQSQLFNNTLTLSLLHPIDSAQWQKIKIHLIHLQDSTQHYQINNPIIRPLKKPSNQAQIALPYNKNITNTFHVIESQFQSMEDFLHNGPENIALEITNLTDCDNYVSNTQKIPWVSKQYAINPTANSLKISEIMFNNQDDFPDYIEITNTSPKSLTTENIEIQYFNGEDSTIQFVIPLSEIRSSIGIHETWLICNNSHKLYYQFQSTPVENFKTAFSMQNLSAEKGIIQLIDRKNMRIIDRVAYHQNWHHPLLTQTKGVSLERINPNNNGLIPSSWISSCYLPRIPEKLNTRCKNIKNNNGTPGYLPNINHYTTANNGHWLTLHHPIFSYSKSNETPIFSFNPNATITQFQVLIYTLTGKFVSYIFPLQWVDPLNSLPLYNIGKLGLPPGNYILLAQGSDSQFNNYQKKIMITILP